MGEFTSDICSTAARGGHLNCLKYIHENGGQWDKNTIIEATRSGSLLCIMYVHEHGCKLTYCYQLIVDKNAQARGAIKYVLKQRTLVD